MDEHTQRELDRIEIELWGEDNDQPYTAAFNGRWLIDETRTRMGNFPHHAYYTVAVTEHGRIVMYMREDDRGPTLQDYDSLVEAADDGWPPDVVAQAAKVLGQDYAVGLDI